MDTQVIPQGAKRFSMRAATPTSQLVKEFWNAPMEALFDQKTIAPVRGCSEALCERNRWDGGGPPFIKDKRSVRYRKADVVKWLDSHRRFSSTSEYREPQVA